MKLFKGKTINWVFLKSVALILLFVSVFYLTFVSPTDNFYFNSQEQRDYKLLRKNFKIPAHFLDTDIDSVINISEKENIPYHITLNIIYIETKFDSTVTSKIGCSGYMQLNPKYFKIPKNRFDNIRMGLRFLKKMYKEFGSWEDALAYYGTGSKHKKNKWRINYILKNGKDT